MVINYLGNDRREKIEQIIDLDLDFYARSHQADEAFEHFISKGRFSGASARPFDQQSYLAKYPDLLATVKDKISASKENISDSDALKVFFSQRKTHSYKDFSDGRAERQFWKLLALEIDENVARSYSFPQKQELVAEVANATKKTIVDHFLDDQAMGFLGSQAALLLASFSMALERPLSAEFFLLSYDYGIAWSYPTTIAKNASVFPVLGAAEYIQHYLSGYSQQEGYLAGEVRGAIVLGGSSIAVMPENCLVNQSDDNADVLLSDVVAVRISSQSERYAAIDMPDIAARLEDVPYACILNQHAIEPDFFINSLMPAALSLKSSNPKLGFVFDENVPRLLSGALKRDDDSVIRYLAEGASIAISKLYLFAQIGGKLEKVYRPDALVGSNRADPAKSWARTAIENAPGKLSDLLNNDALSNALEQAGFEAKHVPNEESEEAAQPFRESKYIVTFPGTALFNMVFCAPGTKILVLTEEVSAACQGFQKLAIALELDLQFFEYSALKKEEGTVAWVDIAAFSKKLASLFDTPPTVNSGLDALASVYQLELQSLHSQIRPNIALRTAINLSGRLVYRTRKKNYMMINQAFNDAVADVFEKAAAPLLPTTLQQLEPLNGRKKRVCILSTQIYDTGGHTRLLEDIVESLKDDVEISLILTDFRQMQQPVSRPQVRWPNIQVLRADGPNLEVNARSAHGLIEQINPDVMINMAHPYDVISFGFMMREQQRKWLYVVHSDHTFSLIPRPKVADLLVVTEPCGSNFKAQSIPHIKLPLTSEYEVPLAHEPYSSPICEGLLTMSVGPQHKFHTKGSMRYGDLLLARFRAADGDHLHVGDLPDEFMNELNAFLGEHGFANRFKCLGFLPSVHSAILELKVDLYIGSYPVGGGKAPVEAMAAGCPISQCDDGRWGNGEPMVYPEALRWKNMKELEQSIAAIDTQTLIEQRQFSHEFYVKNHSRKLFDDGLKKAVLG